MIATSASQWTVLVPGEHTGGRYAIVEVRERRGFDPPRHVHSRDDEFIYVLEGQVTFERDGERLTGRPGTGVYLPRGCEHTFSVESATVRLLVIVSPAGLERCRSEWEPTGAPETDAEGVERLVATAARYGVAITGSGWPY